MKAGPKIRSLEERFWEKVNKTETCWLWTASTKHGYGRINKGGRNNNISLLAHRVAWELIFEEIPRDKYVLHKCDNTICVNPYHLFLGNPKDNSQDMIRKGRGRGQFKKGHPNLHFGKKH